MNRVFCILACCALTYSCDDDDDSNHVVADAGIELDASLDGSVLSDSGIVNDSGVVGCVTVQKVLGKVLSEVGGAALSGAKVQICARSESGLSCLRPVSTDANGRFEVLVPETANCLDSAVVRALRYEGDRITAYKHADLSNVSGGVLEMSDAVILPLGVAPESLPALGDESESRIVSFGEGLELELTPNEIFTGSELGYADLLYAVLPPEARSVQASDPDFAHVFGFAPEAVLKNGAAVRVSGLSAGATVDFYVLGGLNCTEIKGEPLAEGVWARFGSGVVATSGVVESDALLPCLNQLGYTVSE